MIVMAPPWENASACRRGPHATLPARQLLLYWCFAVSWIQHTPACPSPGKLAFFACSGLVGNQDISNAIFAFTDSIPGAEVGAAYQRFEFTVSAHQEPVSAAQLLLLVWLCILNILVVS
jgi:hypothetical protein